MIVYYADIPVGAICCRFDNLTSQSKEKPPTVVILTLSLVLTLLLINEDYGTKKYC